MINTAMEMLKKILYMFHVFEKKTNKNQPHIFK